MVHLVYLDNKEKELEKIQNKEKTMLIRSAAGRKIPHSRVYKGEVLYFMEKGSFSVTHKAIVSHVENYVKLSEEEITSVLEKNQKKLNLSKKQQKRWAKRCMILVEFTDLEELSPLKFEHQGNMDDWLILEKIEDVLVGTSIPYNYDKSKF